MSSPTRQKRPTREETRLRLLAAAAELFGERGIAATSVEEIAEAAGFSRGAFYSNFADKDDLVLAVLRKASDDAVKEIDELMAAYPDPDEYIRATQELMVSPTRRDGHHHPALSTELMLYGLRNPVARPLLQERLDRAQAAVWRVIERNATTLGLGPASNRQAIAAMIIAMDDGFGLHAMIDSTRDPIEAFSAALDFIGEAAAAIAVAEKAGHTRAPTRPSTRAATGASARKPRK